nr:PREDICTED: polycomb protein Pcl isoform X2 [Megachile rotundata]
MSEPEESLAAPDSTTREQKLGFSHGDDVFLQHKDGKFYLGTIVEVDLAREKCLVKFMDNTSAWSSVKELTKLSIPDSDVMCVVCKTSQPKTDNDIIVCDKCGRGYHQLCHQPQISKEETAAEAHWMCKRCVDSQPRPREVIEPKTSMVKLPPRIRDVSAQIRRESILAILTNNRNRFKCGREIKKRTTIWGLRVRLPPPCPIVHLPVTGVIDDSVLRRCWGANKRLQYLPPPTGPISLPESTKQLTALKQGTAENLEIPVNPSDVVMRGTIYQNSEAEQSSCPSPSPPSQSTQSLRERYSGGGFVKKSFPFPKLSLQRRRRLMALGSSRERMLRKHKKREKGDGPLSKAQGVREARYRKARKLLKNAIAKSKSRNSETSDLPPTPPTSVSGPPTPPATTSGISELSVPSSVELMHPLPPSTPADTSGDETSSRGTLDSFIPPPKDFEGKNNPFRNLSDLLGTPGNLNQSNLSTPSPYNQCPITLPLPLTPVISQPPVIRPAKRQLSEKDIIIDRNGQVKRRRQHRRGRPSQQQLQQQYQHTASKTATILPARNNEVKSEFARNLRSSFNGASSSASSQIGNCVDYALNGRRLRQRQSNDKLPPPDLQAQKKGSVPTSPKCSPVKQSAPDISIDDLKSSVNIYFGAANRIAAGEKFVIRAKRIGPNGQTQYLIEWEGLNT